MALISDTPQPHASEASRLFLSAPHMSGRELDYVRQAFESNYIAPVGPQLNQFEATFCEISGFEHCVAVSNGTSAIHLALRHLGVGEGDVVIGSTLTFIGSVAPVKYLGAELVLIDSDAATWNMDPDLLEQEIQSLLRIGRKPAAVLPTELYGQACDLDRILEICSPHDIPVICDSAESLGAEYRGKFVGAAARAATFSFNGNKIITTSGGGMIGSNDATLIDQCRYLATQARQPVLHYDHHEVGYNYRMSNVLAAIGIGQLEVLHERVAQKRRINKQYRTLLANVPGISFMPQADYGRSNCWLTVIVIDETDYGASARELIAALEAVNIESRPVWNPLHRQKAFADSRCVGGAVAESLFASGVCLPSGTVMNEDDLQRVTEVIISLASQ